MFSLIRYHFALNPNTNMSMKIECNGMKMDGRHMGSIKEESPNYASLIGMCVYHVTPDFKRVVGDQMTYGM